VTLTSSFLGCSNDLQEHAGFPCPRTTPSATSGRATDAPHFFKLNPVPAPLSPYLTLLPVLRSRHSPDGIVETLCSVNRKESQLSRVPQVN
jgi:hypothetical protein